MDTNPPLAESLIQTIEHIETVGDLPAQWSDIGLDEIAEMDALKIIPIVGRLLGMYRGVVSIRDRILLKKILRFLSELARIPKTEREKFREKLESDSQRRKIGENLILLLDQLDAIDKSDLVGKIFAHYIAESIDYQQFQVLTTAVNRTSMPDLLALKDDHFSDPSAETRLLGSGLMEINEAVLAFTSGERIALRVSSLGKLLVKRTGFSGPVMAESTTPWFTDFPISKG